MENLTSAQLKFRYDAIKKYHSEHLEKLGVKLPNLMWRNKYTQGALALICLSHGYPHTKPVTKDELTMFIKQYNPHAGNDIQVGRHLAAQQGWFIVSGTRKDNASRDIPAGSYQLVSLEKCYPGFTAERRDELFTGDYWENLKRAYDYRCACCGSKEGEKHRYWKNIVVTLQKGHKDPSKPLQEGNIIPQCESCNRPDRNYWIYDDKGRVIGVANEKVVDM